MKQFSYSLALCHVMFHDFLDFIFLANHSFKAHAMVFSIVKKMRYLHTWLFNTL